MNGLFRIHSTTISILFLGALLLNLFVLQSAYLGGILLVFFLYILGSIAGHGLAPQDPTPLQWWKGATVLLSIIMLAGSAVYYTADYVQSASWAIALLLLPVVYWIGSSRSPRWSEKIHDVWNSKKKPLSRKIWTSAILITLLLIACFSFLTNAATTDAIRSPWLAVDPTFFLALFFLLLTLIPLLYFGRHRALLFAATSATLFLALATALIVFPIGYGFDSFIHKATQGHIAAFGTITPKPLYYIGQYVLVLFTHHTFFLPVDLIDSVLTPVLTALLLPFAWYDTASHLLKKNRTAAAALAGLFLLPLSAWIVTTPQGLANLWIILTILMSVPYLLKSEKPRLIPLVICALATLIIHPIAGLPIVFYVLMLSVDPAHHTDKWSRYTRPVFWVLAGLSCIILPLSFIANGILSGTGSALDLSRIPDLILLSTLPFTVFTENHFSPLLDGVYFFAGNLTLLFIAISLVTAWYYRHKLRGRFRILLIMGLALFINYLFLSTIVDFSFLIDYERSNYADRLVPMITYFLAPLFILGLSAALLKSRKWPLLVRASFLLLIVALAAGNIYLTYPRDDVYVTGHGYNVSQVDVDTVYEIDKMAEGQPYAVLANQSVSAAAIKNLGFDHYFGDQYFYPIPTGGPFYQYFLDMNDHPTHERALEALALVNEQCEIDCVDAEQIYYVVNTYWWESSRIIETAKGTADEWFSLGDGQIYIFRFDLTQE
jgi:hypothetical protein